MTAIAAPAATLLKTPLYDRCQAAGGKMVDFAGWAMPLRFGSIIDEHHAVRREAGLFDVSHMARLRITGPDAEAMLDRACTRKITGTPVGKVRYSLLCNKHGGVVDDVLVSRTGEESFGVVANASNHAPVVKLLADRAIGLDVAFDDLTERTAMLALQGPKALDIVARVLPGFDAAAMKYYTRDEIALDALDGEPIEISRTGYTGEDGFELVVAAELADKLWLALMAAAEEIGVTLQPCGLGARDTLRLEAGMPLYGHELSEEINPMQAGLGFAVNLKDRDFQGAKAIADAQSDPGGKVRVGLVLDGKRTPREGYPVLNDGQVVGRVTSGCYSPTLERPIAMAYVSSDLAPVGTELEVDLRGAPAPVTVAPLPFYKRDA
ncbi:Glycine cleavage system T protein [Pseudobythopirellula maris]|uniref:Aminomethyltransferase n=1 Tax=Pseudobythopirellula maris TaxID=2527991 RepID=A0A5C5ZHC6_9BACT|nr:glycine cleavage system aminomethyltransferase GcvT [Pseudobythopirellula maris]TWT86281.1 Glycine cleavage system T protein [Pseudobythopirellula maris]